MKTLDFTIMPNNSIYNNGTQNHIMKKEKEYIEKQEILDAIREGLLEIKKRRESGSDGVTLQQLIDELQNYHQQLFLKEAKRIAKKYYSFKEDLEILQNELKINPHSGVDLGNGLRKVRMAIKSKGRGKSHGARVITYILLISENESEINLLTIYDKAERENISKEEIEEITKTI